MTRPALQHELETQVRRMTRRDLAQVLAIDRESFAQPWSAHHFARLLETPTGVGVVAEANVGGGWRPHVVGFALSERRGEEIALLSFAVEPALRRLAIGRRVLARLLEQTLREGRRRVTSTVGESNLTAQLFLQALGFRAVKVLRGHFADAGEDGYQMEFSV